MKSKLSKIVYSALCFAALTVLVGCSALYEPVPNGAQGTNTAPQVQPNGTVVHFIQDTSHNFGVVGDLIGGAIVLATQAGAYVLNRRATQKAVAEHTQQFHVNGP